MPFAGYQDFEDCVSKNRDKADPKAYCAEVMRRTEGKSIDAVLDVDFNALGWKQPDHIEAVAKPGLWLGDRVLLMDDDANSVEGTVVAIHPKTVTVRTEMQTWHDGRVMLDISSTMWASGTGQPVYRASDAGRDSPGGEENPASEAETR